MTYEEYLNCKKPYQEYGSLFLLERKHACLYYKPGKGKTFPCIDAIREVDKSKKGKAKVLILSTADAIKNMWNAEIVPQNILPENTVLMSFNSAIQDARKQSLLKIKWDVLVIDECHKIKAHNTKISKLVYSLSKYAEYVFGLSGTPRGNSDVDIYCQFHNMNIGELRELINRQENINSELNTIDYRLTAGNEFSTLNPGKGGKWVDLPDEVVLKMLDTVSKDDNFDFDLIPIIKYYETEKRTGIPNPQVLKALQCYNTKIKDKSEFGNKEDEFTQDERKRGSTIARRITKDGIKYQGLVPEEGHIAVQPGWVSSRFKKYH